MSIKAAKRDTKANTDICLAFNMVFIDDVTVTAVTNIQDRWILKASNEAVSQATMFFKSKCLVVRKGTVTDNVKAVYLNRTNPQLTSHPNR